MIRVWKFLIVILLLKLPGSGFAVELLVTKPYIRAMPPGQTVTSAYLKLANPGKQKVVLIGAKSPMAKSVEIHQHIHKQGMMRMRQVDKVVIEAGKSVEFSPGSYHLMLFDFDPSLNRQQTVTITLCYGDGSEQPIQFAVIRP